MFRSLVLSQIKNSLNIQKGIISNVVRSPLHTSSLANVAAAVEPYIIKSKYDDVPLSKDTFGEFMWSNVDKYPQKRALVRPFFCDISS